MHCQPLIFKEFIWEVMPRPPPCQASCCCQAGGGIGACPGAGGFIAPAQTFGLVTGALNAPRPPGSGCCPALAHAGMLPVEGGAFSEAAMLLQDGSVDKKNAMKLR